MEAKLLNLEAWEFTIYESWWFYSFTFQQCDLCVCKPLLIGAVQKTLLTLHLIYNLSQKICPILLSFFSFWPLYVIGEVNYTTEFWEAV